MILKACACLDHDSQYSPLWVHGLGRLLCQSLQTMALHDNTHASNLGMTMESESDCPEAIRERLKCGGENFETDWPHAAIKVQSSSGT